MQTIVDHHHASDQKQATKVRFSEPGDEKDADNDSKVNICFYMKNHFLHHLLVSFKLFFFIYFFDKTKQKGKWFK